MIPDIGQGLLSKAFRMLLSDLHVDLAVHTFASVLTVEMLNSFIEGEMDALPDPKAPHQYR